MPELVNMGRIHVEKEPAPSVGHKKIISSLLAGRYLNIQEWVYLHIVLKMRFHVSSAIVGCDALPPGPKRFRLWERLLPLSSKAGSFLNEEDEAIEKRHGPKFEQLRFGGDDDGVLACTTSASLAAELDEEKRLKYEYEWFLKYAQVSV